MQRVFSDSSALVRRLSARFAVRTFKFAAEPSPAPAQTRLTAQRRPHRSRGRAEWRTRPTWPALPVAGVVVVTDGADNGGGDLGASILGLKARRVPVYTVGVGQERFSRDLAVETRHVTAERAGRVRPC